MKRVALWIMMVAFALVVISSAPVSSAVRNDTSDPVSVTNTGVTSSGSTDPVESGSGDEGDADGVAGLKDPSRGISSSALPDVERIILLLRSWWMLFLKY
jgi:hypothetical protein